MNIEKFLGIAVDLNKPALLVGKHGTGKSYSVSALAKKKKRNLVRVVLTGETTPEDIVGMYELKEAETVFEGRPLLDAIKNGKWILFDEINVASPSVLTLLNGLLETEPSERFINVQNVQVKPHKDFRLFATANPTEYAGTQMLNDALLSRFLIKEVKPDYGKFLKIIEDKYKGKTRSSEKFLSAIIKAWDTQRIYISPRELLVFAEILNNGQVIEDATEAILSRFYDMDKESMDLLREVFKVERAREDIYVLNEVELKRALEDASASVIGEMKKMKSELDKYKKYKEKWNKVKGLLK